MTICSTCSTATTWVRDLDGRALMINADPDQSGNAVLTGRYVDSPTGLVPQIRIIDHTLVLFDDGQVRFLRHEVVCPGMETVQPITSESAAARDSVQASTRRLRTLVYDLLVTGPRTDEQIADELDLSPNTARPRRVELCADGVVAKVGTGITKSGRKAAMWGAVDANGRVYA